MHGKEGLEKAVKNTSKEIADQGEKLAKENSDLLSNMKRLEEEQRKAGETQAIDQVQEELEKYWKNKPGKNFNKNFCLALLDPHLRLELLQRLQDALDWLDMYNEAGLDSLREKLKWWNEYLKGDKFDPCTDSFDPEIPAQIMWFLLSPI